MDLQRRPTLADVAREAGCSRSTVSYVILRSKPISAAVTGRVKEAIRRLGYRPYRTRQPRTCPKIALLGSLESNTPLLADFQRLLAGRGIVCQPVLLPEETARDPVTAELLSSLNRTPEITGIIAMHPRIETLDLLARCKNKPCVIYNREGSLLSHCYLRHAAVGEMAARRCLRLGFPAVGVLLWKDPEKNSVFGREFQGFSRTLPPPNETFFHYGWIDRKTAEEPQITRFLESWYAAGIRLIFSWSARFSIVVTQWAYRKKIRIPEELSLFSLDTDDACALTSPPVSAIAPPGGALVTGCVEELLTRIAGEDFAVREEEPLWIERGSTVFFDPQKL